MFFYIDRTGMVVPQCASSCAAFVRLFSCVLSHQVAFQIAFYNARILAYCASLWLLARVRLCVPLQGAYICCFIFTLIAIVKLFPGVPLSMYFKGWSLVAAIIALMRFLFGVYTSIRLVSIHSRRGDSLNICQCIEAVKYPLGPFSDFLPHHGVLWIRQNLQPRESNIFWRLPNAQNQETRSAQDKAMFNDMDCIWNMYIAILKPPIFNSQTI